MQLVVKYLLLLTCSLMLFKLTNAQFVVDSTAIDSLVQIKEKEPIEANFLFSYYEQDGTKSPVTGGIGNEELTDMVGKISLSIPINDTIKFSFLGGVDVYSSASTDNINNEYGLYTETSASSQDARAYGDLGVEIKNDKKRFKFGGGIGVSGEYDVMSFNYNAFYSKLSKNRNSLYYFKASAYHDFWTLIYPSELRWLDEDGSLLSEDTRNTYNGMFMLTQDLNPRMKASISIEAVFQQGLLSTPFHRVYFNDATTHDIERLPNSKLKIPIGLYYNVYINKYIVLKLFYRYYSDDFDVKAHTASIELPIRPTQSFAFIPFYRYHTQTAAKYFKQFGYHSINDEYYTSDFDLGNIETNRVGLELRYSPFVRLGKISKKKDLTLKKIGLRGSKYFRTRGNELILKSYLVSLELSFRFD